MTAFIPPRYELQIIDPRTGRMSREWYKYLALLGNSIQNTTSFDDAQMLDIMDASSIESLVTKALRRTEEALALASLPPEPPVRPDDSLLYWWPL